MFRFAFALLSAGTLLVPAASLSPKTLRAFQGYVKKSDTQRSQRKEFFRFDQAGFERARLRAGEVWTEQQGREEEIPDGMLHHWNGAVFIPGVNMEQTIQTLQSYGVNSDLYKPEVQIAEALSRDGNRFRVRLRFLKQKVITVVLETEHDVNYKQLDAKRWSSESLSTRVQEVKDPGKPDESRKADGQGYGFMWRLNSYWRFLEADGGVYAECEAVSLSRDVPTGLGWMIEPIVRELPAESLRRTMDVTRRSVLRSAGH
jgi:hypothetical protein